MEISTTAHNSSIFKLVKELKGRAELLNQAASTDRSIGDYPTAEQRDRAAEALRCAAAVLEARGLC